MNSIFKSFGSDCDCKINELIQKLSLEKFESDQEVAEETLKVLEILLLDKELKSTRSLIDSLSHVGNILQTQISWDTTPNNIVQRVIKIVKEEFIALKSDNSNSNGNLDLLNPKVCNFDDQNIDFEVLRTNVFEVLAEQKAELEQCQELIAVQGETKIHSDEIIMTCGYCPTVLEFLVRASKKRRFHTFVAECSPLYNGHKMAKVLSSSGIQTTVIQDGAIFSLMSRVNKVIIGCKTVLCNGGMKAFLGASSLASAAKYYSVPLYVCTPTFKFSSEMMEEVKDFDSSSIIIPPNKMELLSNVNSTIAKFDYVPPESITIFITNNRSIQYGDLIFHIQHKPDTDTKDIQHTSRGIAPSYVYRQVMELYHPTSDDI